MLKSVWIAVALLIGMTGAVRAQTVPQVPLPDILRGNPPRCIESTLEDFTIKAIVGRMGDGVDAAVARLEAAVPGQAERYANCLRREAARSGDRWTPEQKTQVEGYAAFAQTRLLMFLNANKKYLLENMSDFFAPAPEPHAQALDQFVVAGQFLNSRLRSVSDACGTFDLSHKLRPTDPQVEQRLFPYYLCTARYYLAPQIPDGSDPRQRPYLVENSANAVRSPWRCTGGSGNPCFSRADFRKYGYLASALSSNGMFETARSNIWSFSRYVCSRYKHPKCISDNGYAALAAASTKARQDLAVSWWSRMGGERGKALAAMRAVEAYAGQQGIQLPKY